MSAAILDSDACAGGYFERPAEKLVLEGYRRWTAGYESGSVVPWEMALALYSEILGESGGRQVLAELAHFVRTLGRCAACPLRAFPFGSRHVCRDECLALGLVAGHQHGDGRAVELCLGALACAARAAEVSAAAAGFASMLAERHRVLLPIPPSAIEDILSRARGGATIH